VAYAHILYEVEGPVATITLNRPKAYNAILPDLENELHQALDQAGLPQDGRSLQFSLAADSSPTPSGSGLTADAGSGGNSGGGHRSS